MRKDFINVLLGAIAFLLTIAMNLRHAVEDYGLQNNGMWSIVAASSSTDPTDGGAWMSNGSWNPKPFTCQPEECIGAYETNHYVCGFIPGSYPPVYDCWHEVEYEYYVGGKTKCVFNPEIYGYESVEGCFKCSSLCVEVSTTH